MMRACVVYLDQAELSSCVFCNGLWCLGEGIGEGAEFFVYLSTLQLIATGAVAAAAAAATDRNINANCDPHYRTTTQQLVEEERGGSGGKCAHH